MTSKDRIAEVVDYSLLHGDDETINAFGVDKATLDRYKRGYRQHFGENADLLIKIRNQYSPEELKMIANGGKVIQNVNDIPHINFKGDECTFGILSDTHYGSIFTNASITEKIFEEMDKRGCQFIAHSGDLTEGMMSRPNHIYELSHIGFTAQKEEAIKWLSLWKKDVYLIAGNHDDSYNIKLGAGVDIVKEICKEIPKAHYLGDGEGDFYVNGINIRLFHGADGGASYALSYRLQKTIESMASKKKPQILATGHAHKAFYLPMYRNVQSIESGCLQSQTQFMSQKRSAAHTGFWIVKFGAKDGSLLWFEPRWYPLYI